MNRVQQAATYIICLAAWTAYGDGDALFRQAAMRFKVDPVEGFPLFIQAADAGNVAGMVGAGYCLENGAGTTVDYAEAAEWYERAAAHNDLKACERLAYLYASCSDPRVHNGEKAVKYASSLARRDLRDPQLLALLAAAYARNGECRKAAAAISRAIERESDAAAMARLRRSLERYEDGEPFPAIATEEWYRSATTNGSPWAIRHWVRKISDPHDPAYDPAQAVDLCNQGIAAGNLDLYVLLGRLHLEAGELDQAYAAFEQYFNARVEQKQKMSGMPVEVVYRQYLKRTAAQILDAREGFLKATDHVSMDGTCRSYERKSETYAMLDSTRPERAYFHSREDAMRRYPKWDGVSERFGYSETRNGTEYHYALNVTITAHPPNHSAAWFMLEIAEKKGAPEAAEGRAALAEEINRYRQVLAELPADPSDEQVKQLRAEAIRHCSNEMLPVNIDLVEELLLKSYGATASPRDACLLGMLYLRDEMVPGDYTSRYPACGIGWLEIAHDAGFAPATRRLARLYAADEDPALWDGRLAVEYAETMMESCSDDDYEAYKILACAYARAERYKQAETAMERVYELLGSQRYKPNVEHRRMLAQFKKGRPWVFHNTEPMRNFATLIRKIDIQQPQQALGVSAIR